MPASFMQQFPHQMGLFCLQLKAPTPALESSSKRQFSHRFPWSGLSAFGAKPELGLPTLSFRDRSIAALLATMS
jgi:hypothetical protein